MSLPIQTLLPLYGFVVTLQFTEATRINFLHQLALTPFIRYLLNSPEQFESLIRVDACEAGRLFYQADDYYRFTVYGLSGSELLLQTLIRQLQNLPFSVTKNDKAMPFRRNCRLIALHDGFSEQPIEDFYQLSAYQEQDLLEESALWQEQAYFSVRLLSPLRLLKAKQQRENLKGEMRFCRRRADVEAALVAERLHDCFADLLQRRGMTNLPPRAAARGLQLEKATHLFWLDADYKNEQGKSNVIGGMFGELAFSVTEPSSIAWSLWVLGQYTGFGQRTSFGLGRYQLQTFDKAVSCRRAFPAQSLLHTVAQSDNLISAIAHVESNSESVENFSADIEQDNEDSLLLESELTLMQVLAGEYNTPCLRGFMLAKDDGSLRALAVPPFRDRILQRAVAQVLHPLLEAIQYQHSYGFRPNRSRHNARDVIQTAWREGYRWVFEADIEDFFDNVSWCYLQTRLTALWDDDPLVAAIMHWMQADVDFKGRLIKRDRGLPQGSPLSPLMANLMLDDFDADMEVAGFKLVRFADDFVVLCKTRERAEQALELATASLLEQDLQLNPAKTRITSMEQGFHYLGYLFVNDMALDSPRRREKNLLSDDEEEDISPHSWLAQIENKPLKITTAKTATPDLASATIATDSHHSGERIAHDLLLCITSPVAVISTCEQRLVIHRDDKELYSVPWQSLQAVLLLGAHHVTTPALKAAMAFNIPVHFCSAGGHYQGVVWNGQPAQAGCGLWLKQQEKFADAAQALLASQEVVMSRLQHIRESLRLREKRQQAEQVEEILGKVRFAPTLAVLNGLEGSATRIYFSALVELVPQGFGFKGRNRRPPLDPFNGLLSLGYSMLYSCVESVLRADGLLPWVGFYHQPHGRHATLASDLMEPFRHVVERQALALLKRGELKLDDFYFTEEKACFLKTPARNLYLSKLMAKFDSKITAKGEAEAKTVFEHLHQQNLRLIAWIEGKGDFKAWRVR